MNKTFGFLKIISMVVMGLFLFISTAWSLSVEYTPIADGSNAGSLLYIATAGSGPGVQGNFGNDLPANVEDVLQAGYMSGGWDPGTVWYSNSDIWTAKIDYFGSIDIVLVDKASNVGGMGAVTGENGLLSVDGNTWSINAAVEFYALKDAQAYALYWLNPAVTNGIWDPGDLRALGFGSDVEISHLSVFNPSTPTQQVPEPAVMLLMGAGLFGIAAFGRRRRNSK